jgi:alkaline phosphatase
MEASAMRFLTRFVLAAAMVLTLAAPLAADGIRIRVTPPDQTQLLQTQRVDLRVEATPTSPGGTVSTLSVLIDGTDVTSQGVLTSTGGSLAWTLRGTSFGQTGPRQIDGTATGTLGSDPISGQGRSVITVRAMATQVGTTPVKAKNVILFIGDGMGVAHRTGARVLAKGYTAGHANGMLAMDQLAYNGLHLTSSLDSLVTDSAAGAHALSTGTKTNNGMEGVFPDNTPAEDDNPNVENLPEFLFRNLGKVTGIVTDAVLTDATPGAFLAHTQNRSNGTMIASQYFDNRNKTGLKVLLGGGGFYFLPQSTPGSRRTDNRNVLNDFKGDGWAYVDSDTALRAYTPGPSARLLGLFNLDYMNTALDKLQQGDPGVVANYPDQPFLRGMTAKAIQVLSQYPDGFFLVVEGAHIDHQSHRMDPERTLYDVIQLDLAVQHALDFAKYDGQTLVLVTADHETGGLALPGVGRPEKAGTRDFVKTYAYGAPGNDPAVLNFTDYTIGPHLYPASPSPQHKLIVSFGAAPDHFEDWNVNLLPRNSSATEGSGVDPVVVSGGIAVANPADPKQFTPGALRLTGVLENGEAGGDAVLGAAHTMTDVPVSAFGPGSSQFARVLDNTEAFFEIVNAFLGTYPVPTIY